MGEINFAGVKNKKTPLISILLMTTMLSTANAQQIDDERLTQLENKLSQALELISSLQSEITDIKETKSSTNEQEFETSSETVMAVQENSERLDEVEEELLDIEDKTGSRALVKSFDAVSLDIGGFLHSAVTHVDGCDGSATSFNRQTFEILMRADLGDKWSAFLVQAFIRESAPIFDDPERRTNPTFKIPGPGI
ncbi:MAG: hypothetical protein P8H03_06525, partial [Emcibacteraceae bacterium]|nr:hypothetical protein [Emcibacteraceae bacterium]